MCISLLIDTPFSHCNAKTSGHSENRTHTPILQESALLPAESGPMAGKFGFEPKVIDFQSIFYRILLN